MTHFLEHCTIFFYGELSNISNETSNSWKVNKKLTASKPGLSEAPEPEEWQEHSAVNVRARPARGHALPNRGRDREIERKTNVKQKQTHQLVLNWCLVHAFVNICFWLKSPIFSMKDGYPPPLFISSISARMMVMWNQHFWWLSTIRFCCDSSFHRSEQAISGRLIRVNGEQLYNRLEIS